MLVGRICIEVRMREDGSLLHAVTAHDGSDQPLSMIESLGMIEMAKDSLLHGDDEEDA